MSTTVAVRMRDGKAYAVRCDRPRGVWGNPLSRGERLTKVRQCAARVPPKADLERLIDTAEHLEQASSRDVSALTGLPAQAPAS